MISHIKANEILRLTVKTRENQIKIDPLSIQNVELSVASHCDHLDRCMVSCLRADRK